MIYWTVLITMNGAPWEVTGTYKDMAKAKRLAAKNKFQLSYGGKLDPKVKVWVVGSYNNAKIDLGEIG
jgi:hypothetical protein